MSTSRFSIDFLLNNEDKDPEMIVRPSGQKSANGLDLPSMNPSFFNVDSQDNIKHQQLLDFHFRQLKQLEYQKHWQHLTNQSSSTSSSSFESLDSATSLPNLINKTIIASAALNKNETSHGGNPLDCLAQASLFSRNPSLDPHDQVMNSGMIKIVEGPSGPSIQLHRDGTGTLPSTLSKLASMKCKNRECNNLCGQINKPRSIYCSKRCQSREQNLRQGRIKNVKKNGSEKNHLPVMMGSGGIMKSSSHQSSASAIGNNRSVLSKIPLSSIPTISSFRPVIPQMKHYQQNPLQNSFASLVKATNFFDDEENQTHNKSNSILFPRTPSPQSLNSNI